jgi:hypothetical protein
MSISAVTRAIKDTGREGFTIAEIMVYMAISIVVIGAMYQVLMGQSRWYAKERELTDVRSTLRAAAEILAVEVRMASASGGDISVIKRDSVSLRSVQGSGTVCGMNAGGTQLGLMAASGEFFSTADDSVMIYSVAEDAWKLDSIAAVYAAGGGDVATCD